MPRLLINGHGGGLEAIELRAGSNRLGRGPTNDFPIEHPTVSNNHCEVVWEDGRVMVRDCNSTNGTFVNNQPIKEALLKPGETLQLGDVSMVLEITPATVAIPSLNFAETPPALLADGSAPCLNHPQVRARRKCMQCQKTFCDSCVHTLRRVGGKVIRLCPSCSGQCEFIPGKDDGKRKKKSLFGALWPFKKTLKISRKR